MPASASASGRVAVGSVRNRRRIAGESRLPRNLRISASVNTWLATKPPERVAEPRLLRRQDRGMRDRQAERVAEQRGDGEPVGHAADEPGFGGIPQQVRARSRAAARSRARSAPPSAPAARRRTAGVGSGRRAGWRPDQWSWLQTTGSAAMPLQSAAFFLLLRAGSAQSSGGNYTRQNRREARSNFENSR